MTGKQLKSAWKRVFVQRRDFLMESLGNLRFFFILAPSCAFVIIMQENLQHLLLERIIESFPKKVEAVDALCKLLSVSKDAVYRRLRGDTLLTPSEIGLLARHFRISLDDLVLSGSDSVYFSLSAFSTPIESVEDYLLELHRNLSGLDNLPGLKVFFTSSEIPVFYFFLFPELAIFKLYVWGRTAWDFDYLKQQAFALHLIPPHAVKLGNEILELYFRLDTTELWGVNIFDNTLNQIEHHFSSGAIAEPEQALMLCDRLDDLAGHLRLMAENGRKFKLRQNPANGSPFHLLHNDTLYTNNTIYVKSAHLRMVFSTFGDPNYLISSDPRICTFTEGWFRRLMGKSVPMSVQSEHVREEFFHRIKRKIDVTRRRIEVRMQETV